MRNKTTLLLCSIIGVLGTAAFGQAPSRITRPVDDTRFIRVSGTTHSQASAANEVGRASGDLPMDRMLLQLKSTPEQDAALEQLLAEQQDPQSANYHRWLSPEEFGERFGVDQEDLDVIAGWLEGHGFRVDEIAKGRRSIEFSGTARQVEEAFHTEIHHYVVDGVRHVANAADLAIPEALAERGGRRGVAARLSRAAAAPRDRAASGAARRTGRGLAREPDRPERRDLTASRPTISPPSTTLPRCGVRATTAPGRPSPSWPIPTSS